MQALRVMSKKELCNAFGFKSYKGLYSLLTRIGLDLKKGQYQFTPKELAEIAEKTGLDLNEKR